jgi:uncharacterized protein (DUF2249 family)
MSQLNQSEVHTEQQAAPAVGEAEPGGCGGECGCGGRARDAAATAPAPVLTVDARLDVRELPHSQRHATVLGAVAALAPGAALVLVAPHAPRPLLAEIADRHGAAIESQWLQTGPEVWQVRLERTGATR